MSWRIAPGASAEQLATTVLYADTGPANAKVRLYSTTLPTVPGAHTDTPMAEVTLAKPCATVANGVLALHPLDAGGAMVLSSGIPRWGEWVNGAGALIVDGTVTDADHDGDFKVAGGSTPSGDNSPLLFAGGLVLLGDTSLT